MEPITLCIKIMIGDEGEAEVMPKMSPEDAKKALTNSDKKFTDNMPIDEVKATIKEIDSITDDADSKEEDTSKTRMEDQTEKKKVSKRLFE